MARVSRRAFLPLRRGRAGRVRRRPAPGCGSRDPTGAAPGTARPLLASPDNPVTWPIKPGNEPLAANLPPERGATLKVYNWTEYIYKKVVKDFEKKYAKHDVKVEISTYGNMDEAVAKLRGGQVAFDVLFPTYDVLGKLVQSDLLRPLNHADIPNIDQVWPVFQNPFYDQAWRYSVPYTAYTTGIAWRVDKVDADVAKLPNPYEALWDQRYRGKVGILDDYREAIAMTLLKNGITDLNTGNPDHLNRARDQLVDLALIVLLRSGRNPVLGHLFLNHLLDYDVAVENMSWNGYQPPQTRLDPAKLVEQELLPANLETATVLPEQFDVGYRLLELPPQADDLWHAAWQEFKAGA